MEKQINDVTAYFLAERFTGIKEVPGSTSNAQILAMLHLDVTWPEGDEVPWCSAFVNYVAWLLRLPRSKSLAARSWLLIGTPIIKLVDAKKGYDVVILKRAGDNQPGPEVVNAPGHVGFYSGHDESYVYLLAGNQSNAVNISKFPQTRILGIRRLRDSYEKVMALKEIPSKQPVEEKEEKQGGIMNKIVAFIGEKLLKSVWKKADGKKMITGVIVWVTGLLMGFLHVVAPEAAVYVPKGLDEMLVHIGEVTTLGGGLHKLAKADKNSKEANAEVKALTSEIRNTKIKTRDISEERHDPTGISPID